MNRQTQLKILYEGNDISADIAPYVVSFAYTDSEGGRADELSLRLEDRAGQWRNAWYPQKGAVLKADLISHAGSITSKLSCGTLAIDELRIDGPPSTVTIKAVSSLVFKAFKREKKTRGWSEYTLAAIAAKIAAEHGLTLFFKTNSMPRYNRVDQSSESDLAFLGRLCKQAAFALKVAEEKIIIYEFESIERQPAVATISLGPGIKRYSFCDQTLGIYRACEVQYHDPETRQDFSYLYEPPDPPISGQVLKINQRVESLAGAIDLATRSLREANKVEQTGEISIIGDPSLLAGLNIAVSGFGVFDAKYFITEACHRYSRPSGYSTEVRFRRVI